MGMPRVLPLENSIDHGHQAGLAAMQRGQTLAVERFSRNANSTGMQP